MNKIINVKDLPSNFSFESEATYSGKTLPILSEKDVEIIVKLDPYFKIRRESKEKIWKNLIGPFSMFLHKYLIYKDIFLEKRIPKNITIFSIIEDALKQSITDLARLMTSFIIFIDECNGKYSNLFRNKAERKLFEFLIKGNSLENQKKFKKRQEEILLTRNQLFKKFNSNGAPSSENFEELKSQIERFRQSSKTYRDQIAAHNDQVLSKNSWDDLDHSIECFKKLLYDFYTVMTFEMECGEAEGPGLLLEETKKILIKEIYY